MSENSSYQMNSFDCILVQNGTLCEKKWNTYCFLHQYFAFVIVLLGESFWRVTFSSLTSSSWNLFSCFYTLANHSIATSKMSLQRSVVCKLRHSNCNVWCGDISDVCYVLSVTVCVRWFCHCIVTKRVKNYLSEIIWEYVKYHHKSECLWLQTREW